MLSEEGRELEAGEEAETEAGEAVALPFSSGTTGLPKGVVLTHRSLITSVAQQVDGDNPNLHLRADDVVLCVLPLFHIFSLNSVLLCALRAGSAVLLMPKFDMGALLAHIQRHRVSVAAVVPPLVLALANNPPGGLQELLEACHAAAVDAIAARAPGDGGGPTGEGGNHRPVGHGCLDLDVQVDLPSVGFLARGVDPHVAEPPVGPLLPQDRTPKPRHWGGPAPSPSRRCRP